MKNRETLQQLVLNTVHVHPEGVSHVQLVRYILETGYRHPGSLSADLMKIVRILRKQGVIEKNLETREIKPKSPTVTTTLWLVFDQLGGLRSKLPNSRLATSLLS